MHTLHREGNPRRVSRALIRPWLSRWHRDVVRRYCLWGIFAIVGLVGCVPSSNPLFDERTSVESSGLLGIWRATEGDVRLIFLAGASKVELRMLYFEKRDAPVLFTAVAVRLGNKLYLDIKPVLSYPLGENTFVANHYSTWHTFAKMEVDKGQLRLWFADPQWLASRLSTGTSAISHFSDSSRVVLTASTQELQAFVVANEALFSGSPAVLSRDVQ